MRDIWFKGKRKDNDEWVEGYYIMHSNSVSHPYSHTDGKHCINTIPHGFSFEVDPETVCQYTGLTDKDGRKIFEGDILSAHLDDQHPEDITYVQITWDGFSWCARESTEDDVMTEHDCNTFEVCGNIFNNPELIGDQP